MRNKETTASQRQKPNRTAQGRAGESAVTITVLDRHGKLWCRVRMHRKLYGLMQEAMKKMRLTLDQFIMAAVESSVSDWESRNPQGVKMV
jgi:hypothetical protein